MELFEKLFQRWGCKKSMTSGDMLLVPSQVLEGLVTLAFGRVSFSEKQYMENHPDVAMAVRNKEFTCGLQHFIWCGIKEGRALSVVQIDPRRYLELNPDLAEIAGLKTPGALIEHWLAIGWQEGRRHKE